MGKVTTFKSNLTTSYYSKWWGKLLRGFVQAITFFSVIFAIFTGWKAINDTPTKVNGYYSRYVVGKAVSYSGEIVNHDDLNAEKLSFKGKFKSKINRIDVETPDIVEMKEHNNLLGFAQFSLERLSSGNHCQFDIIVDLENDKNGDIQISWRGGKAKIELHEADRNFVRGIELSEKVRSLDVSHDARRRWIDNNTKIIGAAK